MAINNNQLNEGFSLILSYLDSVLKEQKTKAHNAIDMPDWEEAQKVLISANQNISLINSWKMSLTNIQREILESSIIECNADVVNTDNTDDNNTESAEGDASDKHEDASIIKDIVEFCEDMILHNPYPMAIIDSEPDIGRRFTFTYNENDAKIKMDKPVQLSNGLWVEADGSDDEIQYAIKKVMKYCGCNKHNLM